MILGELLIDPLSFALCFTYIFGSRAPHAWTHSSSFSSVDIRNFSNQCRNLRRFFPYERDSISIGRRTWWNRYPSEDLVSQGCLHESCFEAITLGKTLCKILDLFHLVVNSNSQILANEVTYEMGRVASYFWFFGEEMDYAQSFSSPRPSPS